MMAINFLQTLFYFSLSPLLTSYSILYGSISNAKWSNWKGWSLLLFFFFYGAIYFVPESSNNDEVRFQEIYFEISQNISSFSELFYYVLDSKAPLELLVPIVAFISNNETIYFILLSLIYGIIFVKIISIFRVTSKISVDNNKELATGYWVILIYITNLYPFWNCINGFRFASASMLFFIAIVSDISNAKRWAVLFLTLIFHNSALLMILIYFLVSYLDIKYRNLNFLFYIYLVTLVYSFLDLKLISNYLPNLIDLIGDEDNASVKSFKGYADSDYLFEKNSEFNNLNWNVKLSSFLSKISTFLIAFITFVGLKSNNLSKKVNFQFFYISMLFLSVSNVLADEIGSIERFNGPALLLLVYSLFSVDSQSYPILRKILIVVLFLLFLLNFRNSFDLTDVRLFQPVIFAAFNDVSLRLVEVWEAYGGINN
jgi:hypothetical protein